MSSENEYVAREIRKSGFPLEVEIAEQLEALGWEVLPSSFYLDYDDGQFKETDILAYMPVARALKDSANYPYLITIGLLVECKKRENAALVFFPRARKATDIDYSGAGLTAIDSFQVAKISSFREFTPALTRHRSIGLDLKPKAYVPIEIASDIWGAHQLPNFVQASDFHSLSAPEKSLSLDFARLPKLKGSFKRSEARKEALDALAGLAKAAEDRIVKDAEMLQLMLDAALDDEVVRHSPHMRRFSLSYYFPVLVFDGKLKTWKNGRVSDAEEALYEVTLRSGQYFENRLVSLVTKDHFADWVKLLRSDAVNVVRKIVSQKHRLDGQVELLLKNRILSKMKKDVR